MRNLNWKTFSLMASIVLLGGILRFWRLGDIPAGLHRDEAFLGYNSYSLLKTGKDLSGNFLPVHLHSFLYSPAGYTYLSLPFISLFDLNAFSVRFTSALWGTLTILLTFWLTQALLKKPVVALGASFFLAISPWHINLSRTSTENTVVVFLVTVGIFLYLRWRHNSNFLVILLSFLSFAATLAIYQAPRAFLPIFIPVMAIALGIPRHRSRQLAMLYVVTILLPLVFILSSPQLSLRIKTVSIFASQETQLVLDEQIREDGVAQITRTTSRIFHNKAIGYTKELLENYFAHFTYDFLFTDKGLPDRYRIPGAGLLYLFELPLIFLGIAYLWQHHKREAVFLLGWIMAVPIGSALTFDDVPNLQRTLLVFPALSLITAAGAINLATLKTRILLHSRLLALGKIALVSIALYNISFYLHQYYVHQPRHRPWFRHEGYRDLVTAVNNSSPNYQKTIITTHESAPTIFFLFFSKYDPQLFQQETHSTTLHDLDRVNFGHFEFSQEECPLRLERRVDPVTGRITNQFFGEPNVLYVNFGTCQTPEKYAEELRQIRRGDNSVVFKLVAAR